MKQSTQAKNAPSSQLLDNEYKVSVIDNTQEWLLLKDQWNLLLGSSKDFFNHFLSFEWLYSWWEAFGQNRNLFILVAHKDRELVGIAPLMITSRFCFGICEFIGSVRSDLLGFICSPSSKKQILNSFMNFLADNKRWHIAILRDFPEDLQLIEALSKSCGFKSTSEINEVSPRLIMPDSWEAYLQSKKSKHRGNIKRLIKNIHQDPNITVACIREYSPDLVEQLASVEAQSWKVEEGEPRFSGQGKTFFDLFLKTFSKRNWLEVWTLSCREKLLAYQINFVEKGVIYYYNGSFIKNSRDFTKLSVGSGVTAMAIQDAFDRGFKVFDFLRGDEPYKKLWVNDSLNLHRIFIYNRGLISQVLYQISGPLKNKIENSPYLKTVVKNLLRAK